MRPHTRILYSLCDRITGEARGARQKTLGLTRRGLSTPPRKRARWGPRLCRAGAPNARLWRVGVEDIKGRALDWLDPAQVRWAASEDASYGNSDAAYGNSSELQITFAERAVAACRLRRWSSYSGAPS